MPVKYTAMLYRSKYFSSMTDIHDEDRISQTFNIFLDCELPELSQVVTIASLNSNFKMRADSKSTSNSPPKSSKKHRKMQYANSSLESSSLAISSSVAMINANLLAHNLKNQKLRSNSSSKQRAVQKDSQFERSDDNFELAVKKSLARMREGVNAMKKSAAEEKQTIVLSPQKLKD